MKPVKRFHHERVTDRQAELFSNLQYILVYIHRMLANWYITQICWPRGVQRRACDSPVQQLQLLAGTGRVPGGGVLPAEQAL